MGHSTEVIDCADILRFDDLEIGVMVFASYLLDLSKYEIILSDHNAFMHRL